jgi:hypothetical protein
MGRGVRPQLVGTEPDLGAGRLGWPTAATFPGKPGPKWPKMAGCALPR